MAAVEDQPQAAQDPQAEPQPTLPPSSQLPTQPSVSPTAVTREEHLDETMHASRSMILRRLPVDGQPRAVEARRRQEARGQYRLALKTWSIPLLMIGAVVVVVYLLSFWLNVISHTGPGELSLVDRLIHQDLDQARSTVGGLGEVMAAVLGLALTVSSIIVQLAATRFTPHITVLFFRARTNVLVLGFFVVSTVFVVWVNFSLDGADYAGPRWDVMFSMLLMTASLLLLFPYFAYVFDFLDPNKIIARIKANGLDACTTKLGRQSATIEQRQRTAVEAVEHLTNIGLNALQQKDKNIVSTTIDAMREFCVEYGEMKNGMVLEWFKIPDRQSPDFVSLSSEAITDLRRRRTWLEWKVLRQYQMLFTEGQSQIKDICYLIAINTRRLGEAAAVYGDLRALDLAIKFFNTYLRATINASDIRTAYNILHQYRQLGETVLEIGKRAKPSAIDKDKTLADRAIEIAHRMRYYSGVSFQRGMAFIAEVIAHDIGTMCERAFQLSSECHDELLKIFLAVDDATESADKAKALRGVRKAQIKLATHYLVYGAGTLAKKIADDMRAEDPRRLRSMWTELANLDTPEFWEVNDRGSNFDYLTPEQKATLPRFFQWFDLKADGPTLNDSLLQRK